MTDCDIEDFNVGLVHFEDGSTMAVESNWMMHPRPRPSGAEILGDWGTASLRPLRVALEEGDTHCRRHTPCRRDKPVRQRLSRLLPEHSGKPSYPLLGSDEMLDVQRVMDALYEAAEKGREVTIAD